MCLSSACRSNHFRHLPVFQSRIMEVEYVLWPHFETALQLRLVEQQVIPLTTPATVNIYLFIDSLK